MQTAQQLGISEADYLAGEAVANDKHEFLDGQVRMMAGETKDHNRIALSTWQLLNSRLASQKCSAFVNGLRVHVATANRYYYPDVIVTCDERDHSADAPQNYVNFPSVIVEVLSTSTESIDRGEKLNYYKVLPTLQAYVLVDQFQRRVELYRRGEGRLWLYEAFETGETFSLPTLGVDVAVDELYLGTSV